MCGTLAVLQFTWPGSAGLFEPTGNTRVSRGWVIGGDKPLLGTFAFPLHHQVFSRLYPYVRVGCWPGPTSV